MKSSKIRMWCEIPLVKVLAKLAENRDNLIISENSPFYQHESVGKMRSFVGQVETSVKQHVLSNMKMLDKWGHLWDELKRP